MHRQDKLIIEALIAYGGDVTNVWSGLRVRWRRWSVAFSDTSADVMLEFLPNYDRFHSEFGSVYVRYI